MDGHGSSAVARTQALHTDGSLDQLVKAISAAGTDGSSAELARAQEEIEGLHAGLRTRTTIGQAVGLLMRDKALTSDEAFGELVEMSMHANVKLRDIAARMVEDANAQAHGRRET